jgi:hypothetical protein
VLSLLEYDAGAGEVPASHDPAQSVEPGSSSTHPHRYRTTVEEVEDEDMPPRSPSHGQIDPANVSLGSEPMAENAGTNSNDIPSNKEPLERPSEYLRKRCPLCFGGDQTYDQSAMCV